MRLKATHYNYTEGDLKLAFGSATTDPLVTQLLSPVSNPQFCTRLPTVSQVAACSVDPIAARVIKVINKTLLLKKDVLFI